MREFWGGTRISRPPANIKLGNSPLYLASSRASAPTAAPAGIPIRNPPGDLASARQPIASLQITCRYGNAHLCDQLILNRNLRISRDPKLHRKTIRPGRLLPRPNKLFCTNPTWSVSLSRVRHRGPNSAEDHCIWRPRSDRHHCEPPVS